MIRRLAALAAGFALACTSLAVAAPAKAAVKHDPVITVYGFGGYSQQFDPIKTKLVAAGWSKNGFYDFGYIGTNSNVQIANELKAYVDNVKKQTGAAKVDLLVHSMGAISSRYYLKFLGGSTSVDAWIALGGADQGTTYPLLALCAPFFAACADMTPGSPILTKLNTGDWTPGSTRYYTHYSTCDGVITPYTNILVETATNTAVTPCVAHNDYFSNASVQTLVQQELG
jgi:triacylglycerol lipase